jgi:hypothetical protein
LKLLESMDLSNPKTGKGFGKKRKKELPEVLVQEKVELLQGVTKDKNLVPVILEDSVLKEVKCQFTEDYRNSDLKI